MKLHTLLRLRSTSGRFSFRPGRHARRRTNPGTSIPGGVFLFSR